MNRLVYLILALSLAANAFLFFNSRQNGETVVTVTERDTIVERETAYDTVYVEKWKTKTEYQYRTITLNDTVWIENSPKVYSYRSEDYDLDVQAVKMDWHKLTMHSRDTIRLTETVIREQARPKQPKWTVSIGAGAGYGVFSKQPDLFIGISVGYSILQK